MPLPWYCGLSPSGHGGGGGTHTKVPSDEYTATRPGSQCDASHVMGVIEPPSPTVTLLPPSLLARSPRGRYVGVCPSGHGDGWQASAAAQSGSAQSTRPSQSS